MCAPRSVPPITWSTSLEEARWVDWSKENQKNLHVRKEWNNIDFRDTHRYCTQPHFFTDLDSVLCIIWQHVIISSCSALLLLSNTLWNLKFCHSCFSYIRLMSLLVDVNAIIHLIDPELLETVRFDWAHGCTAFNSVLWLTSTCQWKTSSHFYYWICRIDLSVFHSHLPATYPSPSLWNKKDLMSQDPPKGFHFSGKI